MAVQKLVMNIPASTFKKGKQKAIDNDVGQPVLEAGRRYDATFESAKMVTAGGEKKLIFAFDCPEANDGKGGTLKVWYSPFDEDKIQYLFRDCAKLGYDLESLESSKDIEKIVEELNKDKPTVRFSTKQSGEYVNAFIDRLVDAGEDTAAAGEEAPASEEPAEEEKPTKTAAAPASSGLKKRGRPPKPAAAPEEPAEEAPAEEPAAEETPAEESAAEEGIVMSVGDKFNTKLEGKTQAVEIVEVLVNEGAVRFKAKNGKTYKLACYSKAGAPNFSPVP